jgi:hypothetical protein
MQEKDILVRAMIQKGQDVEREDQYRNEKTWLKVHSDSQNLLELDWRVPAPASLLGWLGLKN